MNKIIFIGVAIALFSCKRECDCQQQINELFHSENVDLPVDEKLIIESESSMNIYIDETNVIRLDSDVMTVLADSSNEGSQVKVFPAAKSDFEVFNEILKLSLKNNLKIKIANQ